MLPSGPKIDAPSTREPHGYQLPWVRTLINLCVVLLLIAVLVEAYRWAERRAAPLVKAKVERIQVRAELENTPAWLDKRILAQILDETNRMGARDQATLDRFQNPLDQDVLRDIAANYTGTDADGTNHWQHGANAWIKRIAEVRRAISPDRASQTIKIYAEYRAPAAWVQRGDEYYLIDSDRVRLPETYSANDRKAAAGLMVLTGAALPDGKNVPAPSDAWSTDDIAAGLKLITLLSPKPFASQIAAIDLTNFRGRQSDHEPWIALNTIWNAADGKPRVIRWGRPIGEESFYEVAAAVKVHTLEQLYLTYNRIDADRDYVDIYTEQVRVPKLAAQVDDSSPGARG